MKRMALNVFLSCQAKNKKKCLPCTCEFKEKEHAPGNMLFSGLFIIILAKLVPYNLPAPATRYEAVL